jgi:hypothetical protein
LPVRSRMELRRRDPRQPCLTQGKHGDHGKSRARPRFRKTKASTELKPKRS